MCLTASLTGSWLDCTKSRASKVEIRQSEVAHSGVMPWRGALLCAPRAHPSLCCLLATAFFGVRLAFVTDNALDACLLNRQIFQARLL